EISGQVGDIQRVVHLTVDTINAIRATIGKIGESSNMVAAAVQEQGAATREIVRNVQETADKMRGITSSIGDISKTAQSAKDHSDYVFESVNAFSSQSKRLGSEIGAFLENIGKE